VSDDPLDNSAGAEAAPVTAAPPTSTIARDAAVNSVGNIASRVLGLVREAVIAGSFGASGATSAFDAVSAVPKMVYELLVGGMLSSALVPVLSEYTTPERESERDHVLSVLFTLMGVALVAVVVLLELGAPWIAPVLVGGFDAELLATTTLLIRLIVPSILIYGLSGILQAFHYARKRFVYPSLGAPAHNLGFVVAVVLLASRMDVAALSIASIVAAATQLIVQLPGLKGVRLRLSFDWRHPVIRRLLILYAPVVLSIVIQNAGIIIDRNLASRTIAEAITYMNKATFLIQLPLGPVSMAISLAVLPTLSQLDAARDRERFNATLARGLRLVLVVIIPAAAGLLALGRPIIELIYEHGAYSPQDTAQTVRALQLYLIGLPFAAIDLPLVFAFYAQKDTVRPVVVGIAAVAIYLLVGPTLAFVLGWGFYGLVAANSVQLTAHALIMLWLFRRRYGGLAGLGVGAMALKALAASAPVAAVAGGSYLGLRSLALGGMLGEILRAGVPSLLGIAAFLLAARLLHIDELDQLWRALRRKLLGR
jgi:putative peptidoglycan lipid II flippase